MVMIKNKVDADKYATEHGGYLVSHRESTTKHGAFQFRCVYAIPKSARIEDNTYSHTTWGKAHWSQDNKVVEKSSIKTKNCTLWNYCGNAGREFDQNILKTLYVILPMLCFGFAGVALPCLDWAVGFLRPDHEVITTYKKTPGDKFHKPHREERRLEVKRPPVPPKLKYTRPSSTSTALVPYGNPPVHQPDWSNVEIVD